MIRSITSGGIFFLFLLFPLIVVTSLDVGEDLVHVDVDVGQYAHHGRHLSAIDPLLLLHSARVPTREESRKMTPAAS